MKLRVCRERLIALVLIVVSSTVLEAIEIARSSPSPLRYPRLFIRERIEGNALFLIRVDQKESPPAFSIIDTTEPRLVQHAEDVLKNQNWEIPDEVTYPLRFEAICTYHYKTKRLQIWVNSQASQNPETVTFEDLSGKPVPQRKIELPVPQGEAQKSIVLKVPVKISKLGRVQLKNPEKRESTPFHRDAYAVLEDLIFTPPVYKGRPVDTEVILPVVFKLRL